MLHETFMHKLATGENVKFTIASKEIHGQTYYYAHLINTDLEIYQKLSETEKHTYYGMEMGSGTKETIYYKDRNRLKTDIKMFYGIQELKSEI